MPDLRHRLDHAGHRRLVEALAHVPRVALLLGLCLNVAARQVEADGVAENEAFCLVDRNIRPAGTERDDQLDFVVQVPGQRRVGDDEFARAADHGIARLHEEERRLAPLSLRVRPHLAGMIGIIASDTINAAHPKEIRNVLGRQRGVEMRREYEGHDAPFCTGEIGR